MSFGLVFGLSVVPQANLGHFCTDNWPKPLYSNMF